MVYLRSGNGCGIAKEAGTKKAVVLMSDEGRCPLCDVKAVPEADGPWEAGQRLSNHRFSESTKCLFCPADRKLSYPFNFPHTTPTATRA
jgi:hypothetical protein